MRMERFAYRPNADGTVDSICTVSVCLIPVGGCKYVESPSDTQKHQFVNCAAKSLGVLPLCCIASHLS
jgi:hypothetical protein